MKPLVVLFLSAALPWWAMAQTPATPAPANPEPKAATAPAAAAGAKSPASPKITLGPAAPAAAKTATAPGTTPGAKVSTTTKAPVAKGAADKTAKKDEAPPKIEGMEIARGAKGFLGLQIVGGNFRLAFYDAKKKPIAPDVVRAVLRWTPNYKPAPEIYVLGPGDGKSLSAAKTVRPPYSFKLFMSLFAEGVEDPVESFVLDFRQ